MRVALVTNFCPHYRRPLFLELSRRMELRLIMTSRGKEWYWQGERPFDTGGVPAARAPGRSKSDGSCAMAATRQSSRT